jgi:hypothetical protein
MVGIYLLDGMGVITIGHKPLEPLAKPLATRRLTACVAGRFVS